MFGMPSHRATCWATDQGCRMLYFQTKNCNLGKFFQGLAMEDVGIFFVHLVYFMAIWYILWSLGTVCWDWVYFSPFCILYQENLATLPQTSLCQHQCQNSFCTLRPGHKTIIKCLQCLNLYQFFINFYLFLSIFPTFRQHCHFPAKYWWIWSLFSKKYRQVLFECKTWARFLNQRSWGVALS
jgi:hypothetical protein